MSGGCNSSSIISAPACRSSSRSSSPSVWSDRLGTQGQSLPPMAQDGTDVPDPFVRRQGRDVYTRTGCRCRQSRSRSASSPRWRRRPRQRPRGPRRGRRRRYVVLSALRQSLRRHPVVLGGRAVRHHQQHRLAGHRLHRAARLATDLPHRPRLRHHRQAERLRAGRAGAGRLQLPAPAAAHRAQRRRPGHRRGDHRAGTYISPAEGVLGLGRQAAKVWGSHLCCRPRTSATPRTRCCGPPGARHHRPRVHHARRRGARRPRPEAG
ncbi:hypothetical protein STENM327S_06112 [Streptomyces tendae]